MFSHSFNVFTLVSLSKATFDVLSFIQCLHSSLSEALDLVASKDGKELFMALSKRKGAVYKDVNAVLAFSNHFNYD
ncbi:hypothetical protein BgiMline_034674, partial [Biomphalaria glabrata]